MGFWSFITNIFSKPSKPSKPTGGTQMGNKKALLVGINAYPGARLSGCVNDAHNLKNMLIERYGFSASQIKMLTDKDATTKSILSSLDWLKDSKAGDTIFFAYSGHGAQTPTSSPDELDNLSEVICPVDFDWSPRYMITDKQFVTIFSQMPAGVIFNWISDSCHSGDLDREIKFYKPVGFFAGLWHKIAFWQEPVELTPKFMPLTKFHHASVAAAKSKGAARKSLTNGVLDVGFVSGCKDNQTSADTVIGGKPCGALTYFFIKNVTAMPDAPLSQVVAAINSDLASQGYEQQPCCEGTRANKPFLKA
jgi:hypothetical protein